MVPYTGPGVTILRLRGSGTGVPGMGAGVIGIVPLVSPGLRFFEKPMALPQSQCLSLFIYICCLESTGARPPAEASRDRGFEVSQRKNRRVRGYDVSDS